MTMMPGIFGADAAASMNTRTIMFNDLLSEVRMFE
jgi:hypothetical protein